MVINNSNHWFFLEFVPPKDKKYGVIRIYDSLKKQEI